jgi:polyphosphate kinase 2 (PPK2 family)
MFESDYLVPPGKKFKLKDRETDTTGPFKDKAAAEPVIEKNKERIHELQEVLYAEAKHALLIVFQAIDAGGKDRTVRSTTSSAASTRRAAPSRASSGRRRSSSPTTFSGGITWRCRRAG